MNNNQHDPNYNPEDEKDFQRLNWKKTNAIWRIKQVSALLDSAGALIKVKVKEFDDNIDQINSLVGGLFQIEQDLATTYQMPKLQPPKVRHLIFF